MIMSGYKWQGDKAFKEVYFTGMVRDKQRRKMSKSLGNSPDALGLIEKFGADGVRFGVLSSSPAGGDLLFDDKLCEQGRNFCNKMWNALRLIKGWPVTEEEMPVANQVAIEWLEAKRSKLLSELKEDYAQYRLSDVTMKLYSFVWNDFCSWYLEMIKPAFGTGIDRGTLDATVDFYEEICILLHPLMPFITEEVWHHLKERPDGEDCIVSSYPEGGEADTEILTAIGKLQNIVSRVRDTRNAKNLKPKDRLPLYVEKGSNNLLKDSRLHDLLKKMAFLSELYIVESLPDNGSAFLSDNEKYFLQYDIAIDLEAERQRLSEELNYAQGFVASVEKKLSNERFVNNAPEAVVNKEKQKLTDGLERVRILQESLSKLM